MLMRCAFTYVSLPRAPIIIQDIASYALLNAVWCLPLDDVTTAFKLFQLFNTSFICVRHD